VLRTYLHAGQGEVELRKTYIVLIAAALLTTACGGSKKAAAPSTGAAGAPSSTAGATTAGATAGASSATVQSGQYLTAADALDTAYARWRSAIAGKDRVAQLTGPASSYALALTSFDNAILRVTANATGKTATDIQTLVAADGVVIADLDSIRTQTQSTLSAWSAKLSADGAPARVAGDTVRTDFGLPLPAS
jgi:hypothetical protein